MTLTEYAKRRGCSKVAVSKAISGGRLTASVGRDEHGRPLIVDADLADREWEERTRPRGDAAPPAPRVPAPSRAAEPVPAHARDQVERASRAAPAPLPAGVPLYNVSQAVRAAASARREAAAADIAELELASKRGQLIDAEEARADVLAAFSLVKTRLLAVPSRVAQRLPDLAATVEPVVDELIRDALEELADRGGDRGAGPE